MNEEALLNLMRAISKGDEDAFRQFYEFTHQRIFNYIFRLANNRQTAEDLMIDTYTEIWKSAGKFSNRSKVLTWGIGIARNLAMNEFRRGKPQACDLDDDLACGPEQFEDCSTAQRSRLLEDALGCLSIKHREILDLVFLQEMNYEDISRIIDVSVSTIKTRVFYAKEKLSAVFSNMGIEKYELV